MKKLWLVLLSLGLFMAFSVSASAADVKFSGEYYVTGMYLDHVNLQDPAATFSRSTAFFFQRLRVGTDFVVSPCLRLVTRFDAMERVWEPDTAANYGKDAGGDDARNIDFDVAYVDYTSPIGKFQAGYMPDYVWGTIWGNRATGPTTGQIKYFLPIGPVTLVAAYAKEEENDYWVGDKTVVATDRDYNSYRVGPIFNFKGNNVSGETGLLFIYNEVRQYRTLPLTPLTAPFTQDMYVLQPYFKTKLGPVNLQGEINYAFGKRDFEVAGLEDLDINSFTAWLDGDANFGVFSVGGSFAFVQGQDPDETDEINNALTGGRDWNPCLIMYNNNMFYTWLGPLTTYTATQGITGEISNAWFGQLRMGVKPVPQLNLAASVSYAAAHEKPASTWDRDYGWEVDVTGTYKITNNLSYMLGGGYLFTGDYFNAGNDALDLNDDFIIINKLTLDF